MGHFGTFKMTPSEGLFFLFSKIVWGIFYVSVAVFFMMTIF